ncbi:ROK family transcriptional regulator [Qingshengfaniella alkalisoli]|uniref:ROK family transcriptional regulator n=1 Tax=Qingshengfaniella alkalisoli TaxID=2599296 RepID=A0A5B8J1H2_9RHOB|nr:ROK family transcriptional regulator [Qingshengfaniella alkalisoli]QDY70668.1 ROK family transcriptional regulator [Qingshengfaniella alkalisoli]
MTTPRHIAGSNAERTKRHNQRVVLGQIRAAGELGRAEIARNSGLSIQTVSNIIADLQNAGMLLETGRKPARRGLPATQYAINPNGSVALGVEIRPDTMFAALLNLEGRDLARRRVRLRTHDLNEISAMIAQLAEDMMTEANLHAGKLLGAGIVLPGPFGKTGIAGPETELIEWSGTDAPQKLVQDLPFPVTIENDANAAAIGERILGAAKGLGTYAYLYFGAGLGLGVVERGHLIRGVHGNAGEIGHVPVPSDGQLVSLETIASRVALFRTLGAQGIHVETGEELAQVFSDTPTVMNPWLDNAAAALGFALHFVENLYDPETIILGGAMPDNIVNALICRIDPPARSVANRADRSHPRLICGASGRLTATYGAASLVIDRCFTPHLPEAEPFASA